MLLQEVTLFLKLPRMPARVLDFNKSVLITQRQCMNSMNSFVSRSVLSPIKDSVKRTRQLRDYIPKRSPYQKLANYLWWMENKRNLRKQSDLSVWKLKLFYFFSRYQTYSLHISRLLVKFWLFCWNGLLFILVNPM